MNNSVEPYMQKRVFEIICTSNEPIGLKDMIGLDKLKDSTLRSLSNMLKKLKDKNYIEVYAPNPNNIPKRNMKFIPTIEIMEKLILMNISLYEQSEQLRLIQLINMDKTSANYDEIRGLLVKNLSEMEYTVTIDLSKSKN